MGTPTETHAWKLKKPLRNDYVDFSTPEARRRNCSEEVRLNRRLAPDVYLGVVPLTIDCREASRWEDREEHPLTGSSVCAGCRRIGCLIMRSRSAPGLKTTLVRSEYSSLNFIKNG